MHLTSHPLFLASERIACYYSCQGELDTQPLIKKIWQMKKFCYLPVIIEDNTLGFARYEPGDVLHENQYRIFEPENNHTITADKIDLVLMPLLVCDHKGHRLGAGGGYYDRTFAFMHGKKVERPQLLGYAFAMQRVKWLPSDPWDVLMQGVVTEEGVIIHLS